MVNKKENTIQVFQSFITNGFNLTMKYFASTDAFKQINRIKRFSQIVSGTSTFKLTKEIQFACKNISKITLHLNAAHLN